MTDLREDEYEHAADHIEQSWLADQAAAALADDAGDEHGLGRTEASQAAWQIDHDRQAEWAIDKIQAATEERDRIRRNAQARIEQIQAKAQRDEAQSNRTIEFFTGKVIDYRRRLEAANPKLPKTYRLSNGDVCVRAGRAKDVVTDPAAYCEWAIDNNRSAVKVEPRTSGLKGLLREPDGAIRDLNGEIIPGVQTVEGEPVYSVKPETEPEPF